MWATLRLQNYGCCAAQRENWNSLSKFVSFYRNETKRRPCDSETLRLPVRAPWHWMLAAKAAENFTGNKLEVGSQHDQLTNADSPSLSLSYCVSLSSVTQTGKSSRQKANGTRSLLTLFCHMLFAGTFFLPLQLFSANFTRITASLSETIKCNYCRRTKWFSNAATTRSFSICGWELHCIIANWRQVHSSSKRVLAHLSLSLPICLPLY